MDKKCSAVRQMIMMCCCQSCADSTDAVVSSCVTYISTSRWYTYARSAKSQSIAVERARPHFYSPPFVLLQCAGANISSHVYTNNAR